MARSKSIPTKDRWWEKQVVIKAGRRDKCKTVRSKVLKACFQAMRGESSVDFIDEGVCVSAIADVMYLMRLQGRSPGKMM